MSASGSSRNLADMAFGEALEHPVKTDPAEVSAVSPLVASDETIDRLIADFEATGQVDDDGNEYWLVRDIQILLRYAKWDNFLTVIARAKDACAQAGHLCEDHEPLRLLPRCPKCRWSKAPSGVCSDLFCVPNQTIINRR